MIPGVLVMVMQTPRVPCVHLELYDDCAAKCLEAEVRSLMLQLMRKFTYDTSLNHCRSSRRMQIFALGVDYPATKHPFREAFMPKSNRCTRRHTAANTFSQLYTLYELYCRTAGNVSVSSFKISQSNPFAEYTLAQLPGTAFTYDHRGRTRRTTRLCYSTYCGYHISYSCVSFQNRAKKTKEIHVVTRSF